jgi:hypothetical protein
LRVPFRGKIDPGYNDPICTVGSRMTVPIPQSLDSASRWTTQTVGMGAEILGRMERAVAKVRERLLRATAALNQAGIPYAVVGGNAVASWVATVDEGAVRNTRDVDLLVRRSDLPAIATALEQAGFVRDELLDVVMFRDGAEGKPSEAIQLLFASEKTRPDHLLPAPEIQTVEDPGNFRVSTLESLVVMMLTSHRCGGWHAPAGPCRRSADRCVMAAEIAAGIGATIEAYPRHAGRLAASHRHYFPVASRSPLP